MTPSPAFPNPENEEEKTDKAFGHTIRFLGSLLSKPSTWVILGLVGIGGYREGAFNKADKVEYWNQNDIRLILREEISPLEAGFKAWVKTRPANERSVILQAMADEQDKLKRHREN